ncbi:MAG: IMP cyclohydrolase [Candidatus Woesearchaeota archaeon]|nr:IMP cyclohydrolase [Candidatus Woesearchaeota archaeon]
MPESEKENHDFPKQVSFVNMDALLGDLAKIYGDLPLDRHLPTTKGDLIGKIKEIIKSSSIIFDRKISCRYGENPHQKASAYEDKNFNGSSILHVDPLHGKPLSYNNIIDANAALESVLELKKPGVSVIKHTNPCGYATGETLAEAFEAAWFGDPVSAFGSVDAFNRRLDLETAQKIIDTNKAQKSFVEVIIAPEYEPDALEALKAWKKDIRLLAVGDLIRGYAGLEIKCVIGGLLMQTPDDRLYLETIEDLFEGAYQIIEGEDVKTIGIVTDAKPSTSLMGNYDHAWKAAKHTKSNAIVIAREYKPGHYQILGMGAGQPNRAVSVRISAEKARENLAREFDERFKANLQPEEDHMYGKRKKEYIELQMGNCALASDAMFPFRDGIDDAAKTGIKHIIQPGGSKYDDDVIKAANEYGIAMIFTGMRHFRH